MNYMKNILNRKLYIVFLIVTIVFAIFTADGLFYWMLEDKFEIDNDSTRRSEIDWMIRSFTFYLIFFVAMILLFFCKISPTKRKLTKKEKLLLIELVNRAGLCLPTNFGEKILVTEINGITGSLLLFPQGISEKRRCLGERAGECQFQDLDGVTVVATLHLDKDGNLFELDLWKDDYSKVKEISDTFYSVSSS
ncbi:hypothetical protein JCM16496A_31500 [Bacteroides rodentium JCM 16496]